MKKSVLFVLPVSFLCLMGCNGNRNKLPYIHNQDYRNISLFDKNGNQLALPLTVSHFNNSPVGYLPLGNLIDTLLKENKLKFTHKYEGHKYILTNDLTNGSCTVDFDNQTITYDNFDKYNSVDPAGPINGIDYPYLNGKQFLKIENVTYRPGEDKRVIDMSKYNIPMYFDNSYGYVPVDIIGTIITPFMPVILSYNGVSLYLNNFNYAEVSDTDTARKIFDAEKNFRAQGNIYNANYMEYTYNLLALELDFNFGLDKRTYRTGEKKEVSYFNGKAYDILSKYKNELTSLEPGVSSAAYIKFFTENFDEGGHTRYTCANCLSEETESWEYGPETKNTFYVNEKLGKARYDKKLSPSQVIKTQTGNDNNSKHCFEIFKDAEKKNDTAFLTFDEFVLTGTKLKEEEITKDNYWQNTFYTVTYANKQLNLEENKNIKNLVIDLSMNLGGATVAEQFMASWIIGEKGVTTKIRNVKTGSYQEATAHADVNCDGKFDSSDYLRSDINVYLLVSASSFSCGNLLPCQIQDHDKGTILGDRSGGGSCLVYDHIPTGLGVTYHISSPYQMGRNVSTSYSEFTSNENGAQATKYKIDDYSEDNVKKFYNRDDIVKAIHE